MKAYSVTLSFRDNTKESYVMIGVNLDDAIAEATRVAGRKPVWAMGKVHVQADNPGHHR